MSGNHYAHVPPPINMHSVSNANKQRNDFAPPPSSVNQWPTNQPNEFENREKYMETQLTEEHYNSCDLDSNANQNEILDDEFPPPGLRRLVTGQTVSFDDGPASPPFDRIIPGEGNTFNNYPPPSKMSKPPSDPYINDNIAISERFVSGSTTKEYNPTPYQFTANPVMKKDNMNTYSNNNFYSNVENTTFNSSTQDFFDTYLHGGNSGHDVDNNPKANQYPKNKFASLPSGFQNYDVDKRENYFQPEKSANIPKHPVGTFNDDFNKNVNPPFQTNYPPRPTHMQDKVPKPVENIQYTGMENKPNDNTYLQHRRASLENYGLESSFVGATYDNGYHQKHAISQRAYAEEKTPEKTRNEPMNHSHTTNKPDNFQTVDNQAYENKDKPQYPRSNFDRHKKDEPIYDMNSGRMAVEGSSDNASYSKPVPSTMAMQMPNYDYWYSNNSQKIPDLKNVNDQAKLLKEQNAFYANKYRNDKPRSDDKPHNSQNVLPFPLDDAPRLVSPAPANAPPLTIPYENTLMHSKSQSMSSNASMNELPYQNETFTHENAKRYEHAKPESDNTGYLAHDGHNFRANENIRLNKPNPEVQQMESENFTDVKQFTPKNDPVTQNYDNSFKNFENIPTEEQSTPNHSNEQFLPKSNQEKVNQEDAFVRKPQHENFVDSRKPGNSGLEVPPRVENIAKETNSPYRKSSVVNEERVDSDGVTLERGTVPGAQSTPNDNQPNRSFINANSSNYNSTNLFKTIEDEDEREETIHYTDSDEKPYVRPKVLGYNSNTIPGPRSKQRGGAGLDDAMKGYKYDSSFNKSNKNDPPLEPRMVVGETSSDVPVGTANRSRDDGRFDDKSRRIRKDKDGGSVRYERDRKKYDRRERHKVESDDEDYEDDQTYDNSPDRDSRYDKQYRTSPRRLDKRSLRRDRESSFTQSQDESYFDDDDDDYDTSYRNQRRYYDRMYPRDPAYNKYGRNQYYRDDRYRRADYYGQYEEEPFYREGRNSRPSSRSGSEYRRDFADYANPRHYSRPPYYEYLDHRPILHYGGGPRMNKREVEYWSKVREVEPQKYMNWFKVTFPKEYLEWYSRHVTGKMVTSGHTYPAERRGSGHSGQSSVNNDTISVVEEKMMDISRDQSLFKPVDNEISTIQETRCTPAKFTIPHVKGIFNSLGQLIVVNACSPQDGQSADIDFYQVSLSENDTDYVEFMNFTGPFIVEETHLKTLRDFVRYHADVASHPSEKLLYQLIDLIIGLRGVTDGIAIADLLMDNYRESQQFNVVPPKEESKLGNSHPQLSEAKLIEQYTDLLLQGDKCAALDYAMTNKLWGHAFLLASKMGQKYYSNVLAKFDSSISANNPLKTLYQFYSKQIPLAATACADEKWGDWRPHLAMILSNLTSDSEFDKQAIITLGDSLSHKDIFAAHFCYLSAQADFEPPTKPTAKYTLLSLRNNVDSFGVSVSNHAVLLTQIYEFAKRLQRRDFTDEFAKKLQNKNFSDEFVKKLQKRSFTINALLPYKYLLATRLIDFGRISVALQYLESIALDLIRNYYDQDQKADQDRELLYNVIELSEKLKYSDTKPLDGESSWEKEWLNELKQITNNNFSNEITYPSQNYEQPAYTEPQLQYSEASFTQQRPIGQQTFPKEQPFGANDVQQPLFISQPPPNQPMSLPTPLPPQNQQSMERRASQAWGNFNQPDQRNIMSPDYGYPQQEQYNNVPLKNNETFNVNDITQNNDQYDQMNVPESQQYYSPWDQPQQPVSISATSSYSYFDKEENKKPLPSDNSRKEESQSAQPPKDSNKNSNKDAKPENGNNSGWLGGLFGKLSLRPKNEMKLPDDKNKSIVWSKEKGRWVDVNGDDDAGASAITAPPKASEMNNFQPQPTPNQINRPNEMPSGPNTNFAPSNKPPVSGSNNMYKLSRGKGMKANYVNVLSQSTTPSTANVLPPSAMMDYSKTQAPPNMNLFVPSSDGSSSMPGDMQSSNVADPQAHRNANPDMPLFFNPAQYNS